MVSGIPFGSWAGSPKMNKTIAIAACPRSKTKKGPLDLVQWMNWCQQAFTQVNAELCGGLSSILLTSLTFVLQTDASDRGLGAVVPGGGWEK